MSFINYLVKRHGFILSCADDSHGGVVLILGTAPDSLKEFIDAYSSDHRANLARSLEEKVPEYPIVHANDFGDALELLEKKLKTLEIVKLDDVEWNTRMSNALYDHVEYIYEG